MAREPTKKKARNRAVESAAASQRTALYIRVSTEKQVEEGYSLAAQRRTLLEHCTRQGWTVDDAHIFVDEGISGKSIERPAFLAMLEAARERRIDRIVATKLDRLARNTKVFLQLVEDLKGWGCSLAILDLNFDSGTPNGAFVLTVFAALGELERKLIVERLLSGKKQKATEGNWNGAPVPLGYIRDGGAFHVDEEAAPIVRTIFARFDAGAGQRAIARELTQLTGRAWYASQVGYILRNGMYAGLVQWDGVEADGVHPAIIDKRLYERVQLRGQWPLRATA